MLCLDEAEASELWSDADAASAGRPHPDNDKAGTVQATLSVLRNVSFTIEPGEKAALIVPSGAGKTTIMRLFMRYMYATSGALLIDSHDLRDVCLSSCLNIIAYVRQQVQIFDRTISDILPY